MGFPPTRPLFVPHHSTNPLLTSPPTAASVPAAVGSAKLNGAGGDDDPLVHSAATAQVGVWGFVHAFRRTETFDIQQELRRREALAVVVLVYGPSRLAGFEFGTSNAK
ncbi:hypothetical protein AKJ16_DCAP01708 [Drosera capensis]